MNSRLKDWNELYQRVGDNKKVPVCTEIEEAVIAAILHDQRAANIVFGFLGNVSESNTPFFSPFLHDIYETCYSEFSKGKYFDFATVGTLIKDSKAVEHPLSELLRIREQFVTSASIESHLRVLKEHEWKRSLLLHSEEMRMKVFAGEDVFECIEETEKFIFEAHSLKTRRKSQSIGAAASIFKASLEEPYDERTQIRTRIPELDAILDPLEPQDVTVIAARPGMGKTALALSITRNISRDGFPVAFFSLEMKSDAIVRRLIAMQSGVHITKLKYKNQLTPNDKDRMAEAIHELGKLALTLDDNSISIGELQSILRELVIVQRTKVVVLDYLHLLKPDRHYESTERKVAELSAGLKTIAKQLDIHIIVLSQLNRDAEKRENKKPSIADLRSSGAIEQDASNIILIHDPADLSSPNKRTLILGKQRDGNTGEVDVYFNPVISLYGGYEDRPF